MTNHKVKLIAVTKPIEDGITAEQLIAYCARVSSPKNQTNHASADKLLKYCIDNAHWSIFETVSATVEIETSLFVATQILRHKSFCLSGDTLLTFDLPHSIGTSKKQSFKKTIKEIHDKFHYGAKAFKRRGVLWDINKIKLDYEYKPSELAKIIGTSPENIRTLCQKQLLKHKKISNGNIFIKGVDVVNYYDHSHQQQMTMPMKDIIKKMNIRYYNHKENLIKNTHITDIWISGQRKLFKITTKNGYTLKCTSDHPILTKQGYKSIEECLNPKITQNKVYWDKQNEMFVACNGEELYKSYDWMKQKKQESLENKQGVQYIADSANCSYHTIRKWLQRHKLQFTKLEIISMQSVWNKGKTGYKNTPWSQETRNRVKMNAKRGEEHHQYKGGSGAKRKAIANYFKSERINIFNKFNYTCQFCMQSFSEKPDRIELHHIKSVAEYPEYALCIDDIIPAHRSCHMEYHGKHYNNEFRSPKRFTIKYDKVIHIEYLGVEDVYDLTVEHDDHNFIANGIVVHNCFQQSSARYQQLDEKYEPVTARRQDVKNRQNSIDDLDDGVKTWFADQQEHLFNNAYNAYEEALSKGIAKECARALLPTATTTRLYMTGNLRSWITYFQVRCDVATQLEHRLIALEIRSVLAKQFPIVAKICNWENPSSLQTPEKEK